MHRLGRPHWARTRVSPFEQGRFTQHLEVPGPELERGVIDAADDRLLSSPWAWQATAWQHVFAAGTPSTAPAATRSWTRPAR